MNDIKLIALYMVGIGPKGTPNGHLFANVMADGVDLEKHMQILHVLKHVGWVEEKNYYLTLTNPKGLAKHGEIAEALLAR